MRSSSDDMLGRLTPVEIVGKPRLSVTVTR